MEPMLYCITLGAPGWRAYPAVPFSLAMQEVFSILSSFILVSGNILSFDFNTFILTKYTYKNSICAKI
jgi:hypothetical protein